MKKLITVLILFLIFAFPKVLYAQETCVTEYGGGVVCGVSTPVEEFKPKPTALGDINLPVVGASFMFGSVALFYLSKRFNKVH